MMKHISAATILALVALTMANAASASEPRHARRHAQPATTTTTSDPRNAFDYSPGWGRDSVPHYGVYPGLVYGGATSAPAGR